MKKKRDYLCLKKKIAKDGGARSTPLLPVFFPGYGLRPLVASQKFNHLYKDIFE